MRIRVKALVSGVAAVLLAVNLGLGDVRYQTVALSGQPAPGAGGAVFGDLTDWTYDAPGINNAGQVAFGALLVGPGTPTGNEAIFAGSPGDLRLVTRKGDQVDGGTVTYFGSPLIDNAGRVVFSGVFTDNTQGGVFAETPEGLQRIVRLRDPAPGIEGEAFIGIGAQDLWMNPAGQIAVQPRLARLPSTYTSRRGIWSDSAGTLELITAAGFDAPGLGDGVKFEYLQYARLGPAGHVVFNAGLSGPGVDQDNSKTIWLQSNGSLQLVARLGDAAPNVEGMKLGQSLHGFGMYGAGVASQAQVLVLGELADEQTGEAAGLAIWFGHPGALQPVARTGTHAPGMDDDLQFIGLLMPTVNDSGKIAFWGGVNFDGPGS